jgi:hypothetical protein
MRAEHLTPDEVVQFVLETLPKPFQRTAEHHLNACVPCGEAVADACEALAPVRRALASLLPPLEIHPDEDDRDVIEIASFATGTGRSTVRDRTTGLQSAASTGSSSVVTGRYRIAAASQPDDLDAFLRSTDCSVQAVRLTGAQAHFVLCRAADSSPELIKLLCKVGNDLVRPQYCDGFRFEVTRRGGELDVVDEQSSLFLMLSDLADMRLSMDVESKVIRLEPKV